MSDEASKTAPGEDPPEPPTKSGAEQDPAEQFAVAYDELHGLARRQMAHQVPGHTLQATALVNEVFLKLSNRMQESEGNGEAPWKDKTHLLGLASRAMRSILVDHARKKSSKKRKATGERVALDRAVLEFEETSGDLVVLNEALEVLELQDPRMVRLVELHYFGGCTMDEVSRALDISLRTAQREWRMAKARLRQVIEE